MGISNHNEITPHPAKEQDIRIYEHGYNLRNFHKLVIGTDKVNRFDALFPICASQAQWQLDMLGKECEVLQLNHPSRSSLLDSARLVRIAGYDIMELSGVTTYLENLHYDWALRVVNDSPVDCQSRRPGCPQAAGNCRFEAIA